MNEFNKIFSTFYACMLGVTLPCKDNLYHPLVIRGVVWDSGRGAWGAWGGLQGRRRCQARGWACTQGGPALHLPPESTPPMRRPRHQWLLCHSPAPHAAAVGVLPIQVLLSLQTPGHLTLTLTRVLVADGGFPGMFLNMSMGTPFRPEDKVCP